MFRRCGSILLIVLHLASRVAVAPHAHGAHGNAHPNHDEARPHVHLGWFGWHEHTHDHSHIHEPDAIAPHSHAPLPLSAGSHLAVDCHDCDAVYLPAEIGALAFKAGHELGRVVVDLATATIAAVMWAPAEPPERSITGVLPDDSTPSCPRYLMLRALRI